MTNPVSTAERSLPPKVTGIYDARSEGKSPLPPSIHAQPTNVTVQVEDKATFRVFAFGTPPLSYQWRWNGSLLAGETNSLLTLRNLQTNQAGSYTVVVSNASGTATSAAAVLTVVVPPLITEQPESQIVAVGSSVTFRVAATGTEPLIYQWYRGSVPIAGATGTTFTIPTVQRSDEGYFEVRVSNVARSVVSEYATLTVQDPPVITKQPQSQTAFIGESVTFSVTAGGSGPLRYQWRLNGNPIPAASEATFTIAGVATNHAGSYSVTISNAVGQITSGNATLAVVMPGISARVLAQNPLSDGLVAFYPFDGTVNDASGSGNDGILHGSDWKYSSDRFGDPNSLYLNGASTPAWDLDGAYVTAPRSSKLDFNADFTMSAWVNLKSGSPASPTLLPQNLISNGWDGTNANLRVLSSFHDPDGQDVLEFVWPAGGKLNHVIALLAPVRDAWWQTTVVHSGSNVSIFKNGSFLANLAISLPVANSPEIRFGRHLDSTYPLIGGIDDVRMYNRALSPQEVVHLYQHERNPLSSTGSEVRTLRLSFTLARGTTYQLESSTDLSTWATYGPSFVTTDTIVYQDVDVFESQQYFRLKLIP